VKDFRIEISNNGVSIKTRRERTVYDIDGNPIVINEGYQRKALGVGDFETTAEFTSAVNDLSTELFGNRLSAKVAETAILLDDRDGIKSAHSAKVAALKAQIKTLKAEVATLKGGGL